MSKKTRSHVDDLRGANRLAIEATKSVTDLVEAMHHTIAGGPDLLGRPLAAPVRFFTAPVYGSIRAVTRLVGAGIDAALGQLAPLLGESAPGPEREAVLSALNGVLGDYLSESGNPLAIQMRLRHDGAPLDLDRAALEARFPSARSKLLVLLHGSSMNDRQWMRLGHDHGAALAEEHGYSVIYLHYNSGLHVSTNGRAFAVLLGDAVRAWPVPVDEIVLLGHSMGGLVARSAIRFADVAHHAWRPRLRGLVCLGTPHHGAPLERGGNWIDVLLGVSRYSAPLAHLGKIRSGGVTDLRFGNVLDEDWEGRDRFERGRDARTPVPLPEGVACFAMAGTTAPAETGKRLPGDGLVPVDSALGRHADPAHTLAFLSERLHVAFGTGHLDLLGKAQVYEKLSAWLAETA